MSAQKGGAFQRFEARVQSESSATLEAITDGGASESSATLEAVTDGGLFFGEEFFGVPAQKIGGKNHR
jgi:hypothetical protein